MIISLLGVHVSDICDRVNNQLKVIKCFRNIVSSNTKTTIGCIKLSSCHIFYIVVVYGTFAEPETHEN